MDGEVKISLKDFKEMESKIQKYERLEKKVAVIILDHLDNALKKNLEPDDLLYKDSLKLQSLCIIFGMEKEFDNTYALLAARKRDKDND